MSYLSKAANLKEKAQAMERDTVKDAVRRYKLFEKAQAAMDMHIDKVKKEKEPEDYDLPSLEGLSDDLAGLKNLEKRRIEVYHGRSVYEVMPTGSKTATRGLWGMGLTVLAGVVVAAGLGVKSMWTTAGYKNDANNKYAAIMQYVANSSDFDKEDLFKLEKDSDSLNDIVKNLLQADYPELHNNSKKIAGYKDAIERLFGLRNDFERAKGLANSGDRVGALGIKMELGDLENELPLSWKEHFDTFKEKLYTFKDENKRYEIVTNQIVFTTEQYGRFKEEFGSLGKLLKGGELFEKIRTEALMNGIRGSLAQLDNLNIEGLKTDKVDKLKSNLKDLESSIIGEKGLLTDYAVLQSTKVKSELIDLQTAIDAIVKTDYLGNNPETEVTKLRKLLLNARSNMKSIETNRLEDPWALISQIGDYGTKVTNVENELNTVLNLRRLGDQGDVNALVELIKKYFEHDLDDGKWDGDANSYLDKTSDFRVEGIRSIGDLENKLKKKEGFVKVTEMGLNELHISNYEAALESYDFTKIVRPLRESVEILSGRVELVEGQDALAEIKELEKMQSEIVGLEMQNLDNEESKIMRDTQVRGLKRIFVERETKVLEILNKFKEAVKVDLGKGDLIPRLTDLEELARLYESENESEMAKRLIEKVVKLKVKYKLE